MEDCPETSSDEAEPPEKKKTAEQPQAAPETDSNKTTAKGTAK